MPRPTLRLVVALAATLVASVALAAHRSYDRQVSAPPGGRLTLDARIGSVRVEGAQAPEVIVHADLQGSHSFLSRVHISARPTASGVTVSAREDHGGWLPSFDFESNRVRITVQVPAGYPVDLRTSGGDLEVRSLNAAVRASTSGGDVVIRNVAGPVTVSTSGGDVEARRVKGAAEISTSRGDIRLEDSSGDLNLQSSGGDIHLENDDGKVEAVSSGGDISASLPANHGITLRTGGGDITLLLPRNTPAAIDAESGGGSVTSDLALGAAQTVSGNRLRGEIAGGGPAIELHASGGDIHLGPRS
jgi:hypothetical protein